MKIKENFVILGVASTFSESKGLKDFIKLSEIIDDSFKIVIVGNIDKSILPNNIISINATKDVKKLASYYNMADVFLNLSLEETFGKVTAEALACGTPAIVYNSTASPELIGKNCGYVIEPNNVTDVFQKIQEIKNNGKEFYANSCLRFAKDNFCKEKCINQTLEFYKDLLNG